MPIYPIISGPPEEVGDQASWNKHLLEGEIGLFNKLIWRCQECDEVRTAARHFEDRCPEYYP